MNDEEEKKEHKTNFEEIKHNPVDDIKITIKKCKEGNKIINSNNQYADFLNDFYYFSSPNTRS